ncbi:MAG: long-chain fatty acid--CoA ligase, partial [Sphaerochaetaceae bacterium]|nr:long-chain fatty acid--CoA ligase [Sphaerochaetaceae bacterium]
LKTGDLGVLDKKRYLYLKGRAKNIIVTEGGKNVFPEEIEEHFQLYPQIGQIMVRGFVQNRSTMSEELEAVIYPAPEYFKGKSEQEVSDEIHGIVSSVNAKSVSYKKIARISIASQPMSMTTTKKIQRSKVARSINNLIRMF